MADSFANSFDGLRFQHWQVEAARGWHPGARPGPRRRIGQCTGARRAAGAGCNPGTHHPGSAQGRGDPLAETQRLHRRRRHPRVPRVRRTRHHRRRDPPRPASVPAAVPTALPHGRGDPWFLHGWRHRAVAGLPLSGGLEGSLDPHRPAGSEAGHLSGLGRQCSPATTGRRTGRVRHDADRPQPVGQRRARDWPGRQGRRAGGAGRCRHRTGQARQPAAPSSNA